jgi:hypothetical protein
MMPAVRTVAFPSILMMSVPPTTARVFTATAGPTWVSLACLAPVMLLRRMAYQKTSPDGPSHTSDA